MFRKFLILLLLPALLSADIIVSGGEFVGPKGEALTYDPWPQPPYPAGEDYLPSRLPGATWFISSAINCMCADIGSYGTRFTAVDNKFTEFNGKLTEFQASLKSISANAQKTGSGGGILQIKDWPLSAVLAKGAIDTDHGITVKTVQTTEGAAIGGNARVYGQLTVDGTAEFKGSVQVSSLISDNGLVARGRVSAVSEPTDLSDAATKNYVDTKVANVGTNSVILYTLSGATSTGFTLSPVRVSGVTAVSDDTLPSYVFAEQTIVSDVSISATELKQKRMQSIIIHKSAENTSPITQLLDHGEIPQ